MGSDSRPAMGKPSTPVQMAAGSPGPNEVARRNRSACSGRMGASPGLKSARISKAYLCCVPISMPGGASVMSASYWLPKSRLTSATEVISCIQTPERSGLPSRARGVGAARLGLPSRVRGVPGVGKFNHCACAPMERNANKTTSRECIILQAPDLHATSASEAKQGIELSNIVQRGVSLKRTFVSNAEGARKADLIPMRNEPEKGKLLMDANQHDEL